MHWLEEWREKNGVSRLELARAVNVSEGLIWKLEIGLCEITHPLIANDIANYTGATADQRDSIVHKKHRGTWKPDPNYVRPELRKIKPKRVNYNAREVVMLNDQGVILGTYPSMDAAAIAAKPCTSMTVHNRCARKMCPTTDEFQPYGVTFRYADEWNKMTPEQQRSDMLNALSTTIRKDKRRKTCV